ncbi:uncharacterized protein [Amphiura filiformis]|uniref:uncharacterized protein n=1 Tax=Amphiura filiformis TaxID=82378 RepID=UPI003B21E3BF
MALPRRSTSVKSQDSGYGDSWTKKSKKSIRESSNITLNVSAQADRIELEKYVTSDLPNDLQQSLDKLSSLRGADREGATIADTYFVAALLTHIGGILSMPERNVFLYVPPNAIPENRVQLVYLYIKPFDTYGPKLKRNETWLTPLVECGPSGLTFEKDVFLTLPHCMGSSESSPSDVWKCMQHQGTLTDGHLVQWQKMSSDYHVSTDKNAFTLAISHFTTFGVSGEPRGADGARASPVSKLMKVSVVIEDVEGEPNQLRAVITLVNNEDAAAPQADTLRVRNSEADITVSLGGSGTNYRVIGELQQTIPYDNVWSQYLDVSSSERWVAFILENSTASVRKEAAFEGAVIQVYQEEHQEDTISIQLERLHLRRQKDENTSRATDETRESRSISRQPYYTSFTKSLKFIHEVRFRLLCVILDGTDPIGRGWHALAQELGLTFITVMMFENVATGEKKSASGIMLDDFFKEVNLAHSKKPRNVRNSEAEMIIDALNHLKRALHVIGNQHAENVIDEELGARVVLTSASDGTDHSEEVAQFETDQEPSVERHKSMGATERVEGCNVVQGSPIVENNGSVVKKFEAVHDEDSDQNHLISVEKASLSSGILELLCPCFRQSHYNLSREHKIADVSHCDRVTLAQEKCNSCFVPRTHWNATNTKHPPTNILCRDRDSGYRGSISSYTSQEINLDINRDNWKSIETLDEQPEEN